MFPFCSLETLGVKHYGSGSGRTSPLFASANLKYEKGSGTARPACPPSSAREYL